MSEATPTNLDASLNKETRVARAQHIIAGVLKTSLDAIIISKITKTKDGYRVRFHSTQHTILGEQGTDRSAVLDLAFPVEVRPISDLIEHYQKANRELFLGIGSGVRDYPKKENADPKESQRAFFAHDVSYGIAPHEGNFAGLSLPKRYATPSKMLRAPCPESTHFFNALDYRAVANDTFDTIQMVNVLTDRYAKTTPTQEALRMLKPDTGEFVIMNELGPESHSIFQCQFVIQSYGGIIQEVVFHTAAGEVRDELGNAKRVVPEETIARLQRDYHISPSHFAEPLASGSYCVIVKKSSDPQERGVQFILGDKQPED